MADRIRFETLDAMRWAAACLVVFYHLGHWLGVPSLATNARVMVDFFFCLSGFVLPFAYDNEKIPNLAFGRFLRLRLKRLMPIMVLATTISVLYIVARFTMKHEDSDYQTLCVALALGLLSLPYLNAPAAIGGPQVFPLNGPQYTLFLEIFVNLAWFIGRRHSSLKHWLFITVGSYGLVYWFGLGGDSAATFWAGFPRVTASFGIGVCVFYLRPRLQDLLQPRVALQLFITSSAALLGFCLMPVPFGDPLSMACLIVLSPLIVLSGSCCHLPSWSIRPGLWLGKLSYPMYALQYPVFCLVNGLLQVKGFGHGAGAIPLEFATIMLTANCFIAIDRHARRRVASIKRAACALPTEALATRMRSAKENAAAFTGSHVE